MERKIAPISGAVGQNGASLAALSFGKVREVQDVKRPLYLGNLDAKRDWGHARDRLEGMWLTLEQDEPDDYVLATGENHSVREFLACASAHVGRTIERRGTGVEEKGHDARTGAILVDVDPRYFRPTDVYHLCGDASKAKARLGWRHRTSFKGLVKEMVDSDLQTIVSERGRHAAE